MLIEHIWSAGQYVRVREEKQQSVPAVFLTGAPGSGKTALAHEVSKLLWRAHEPHAVIGIDELARGVLPGGSDDFNLALAATNLAAVWSSFRELGVQRLVLARVVRAPGELDYLCAAVPDCEVTACRVMATPETIRE